MAKRDSPTAQQNEEAVALELNFELRRILNNAYAFVAGRRTSQTFAATTYEELAKDQIKRIDGSGTDIRPSELQRIEKLKNEMIDLVEQVQDIPPERFLLSDSRQDVNTPVEEED